MKIGVNIHTNKILCLLVYLSACSYGYSSETAGPDSSWKQELGFARENTLPGPIEKKLKRWAFLGWSKKSWGIENIISFSYRLHRILYPPEQLLYCVSS
jgi:hypothetical protein